MARMLGTFAQPYCRTCRHGSGPDCPDYSRPKRSRRAHETRAWRREWADDQTEES